jgi:hypothetical protein
LGVNKIGICFQVAALSAGILAKKARLFLVGLSQQKQAALNILKITGIQGTGKKVKRFSKKMDFL